jgi:hypothetical protein
MICPKGLAKLTPAIFTHRMSQMYPPQLHPQSPLHSKSIQVQSIQVQSIPLVSCQTLLLLYRKTSSVSKAHPVSPPHLVTRVFLLLKTRTSTFWSLPKNFLPSLFPDILHHLQLLLLLLEEPFLLSTKLCDQSSIKVMANSLLAKPFSRATVPMVSPLISSHHQNAFLSCPACKQQHPLGACQLKAAGVEHCGLCGLAHFGHARTCPHIKSETQVREMLQALKSSPEKRELVDAAVKYLRGVKGHLVQQKKKDYEKAMAISSGNPLPGPELPTVQQQPHIGNRTVPQYTGPPVPHNGLPRREMPASAGIAGTSKVAPGSVGSTLQGQKGQNSSVPTNLRGDLIDRTVETALQGFLRR